MNVLRIWLMLCFVGWGYRGFAQGELTYLTVPAQRGDGVYTLLDRYGIRTPCNVQQFRRLNDLRKGKGLRQGRDYQLPIYRYIYNGRSIRSTTDRDDYDWAVKIQTYNEMLHELGVKLADYRDDRMLWVPYSSLQCPEEPIPLLQQPTGEVEESTSGVTNVTPTQTNGAPAKGWRGTFKIFGDEYARVPSLGSELTGKVYYLVSGHGGADPGAVGRYGRHQLCEDEYAYDVTLRLAWGLLSHGATVYVITRDNNDGIRSGKILPCDTDERCWPDSAVKRSQKPRLFQRSNAVNTLYRTNKERGVPFQRMVVIHVDSDSRRERVDMYFYHKIDDDASLRLATFLKETVGEKYRQVQKNRGYNGSVSPRDLHMLRETEPTSVFIELGNIRNPSDQQRLIIERNRQLVAQWLFEGLMREAKAGK